ncbi:TerC/Alx family metal homeostasis membrane protein, partial [Mycobacterium sp.]|uniref:TerC/Alx family metal homeostasis membrane protein n=1 Tax=Mycobacterium sp. TaxID=1785 RepID=UPI0031D9D7F6
MGASGLGWTVTVVLLAGLAVVDYAFRVRPAHSPTLHDAAAWSALYVGLAVLFGVGVTVVGDAAAGVEYFACYLSNEALSVDNLFVFLVIVGGFAVPRIAQQKVLLFGIVIAVLARTGFIFVGAAVVNTFSWAFYLFALVLFAAAGSLVAPSAPQGRGAEGAVLRVAKRFLGTSERYHGDRLFVAENGRRVMTPMLLAMIAVGGADLVFAFDSIPALFGLSQNVYLIFTATTFSLLGLRQLYFLLDGL